MLTALVGTTGKVVAKDDETVTVLAFERIRHSARALQAGEPVQVQACYRAKVDRFSH